MNTRIKILRKELNMSQETFGNRLGVTAAGISRIESGKRNLMEQTILLICREFNINEQWLRSGEGDIFRQRLNSGLNQLAKDYQLDELDIKIIKEYIILEDNERKIIRDYILRLANGNSSLSKAMEDKKAGPEDDFGVKCS